MERETKIKINDLSRKFALTNEQLLEYLLSNDVEISNEDETVDLTNEKIKKIINKLNIREKRDHRNESGLKSIKIEGLFGKYNYYLEFENDISVWIAENGIGKTTILTIIVAILTGDVKTLYDINFKKIEVNVLNESYIIDKEEPINIDKNHIRDLLYELENYLPRSFSHKILKEFGEKKYVDMSIFNEKIFGNRYDEIYRKDRIEKIKYEIMEYQYSRLYKKVYEIKKKLKEEIVFYPTYRRIEVGIERAFSISSTKYFNRELTAKYIGFGMGDVKKKNTKFIRKVEKRCKYSICGDECKYYW